MKKKQSATAVMCAVQLEYRACWVQVCSMGSSSSDTTWSAICLSAVCVAAAML
jgi:hypothetical protein